MNDKDRYVFGGTEPGYHPPFNGSNDYWIAKVHELGMPLAVLQYQQQFILPAPAPEAKEENGWRFLPVMPETNKEVLVAIKYDDQPIQAFWTGKEWKGSQKVRESMSEGHVFDDSFIHVQQWIYAWINLPEVPPIPDPFLPPKV